MLKLFPAVAATAVYATVLSCALAQTVYKCEANGKLSYSDRPCDFGAVTRMPNAPAPDPETRARLARQRELAAQLTERDTARAYLEDLDLARARRAAIALKLKCDRLRLRQQWAQEDARGAASKSRATAQVKARRQAQSMALECPS
jgi:hypothetical protein